jgi:hypothetical protein
MNADVERAGIGERARRAVVTPLVAATMVLAAAGPASGQQWTPEQQELVEFTQGCQASKQAWLDCFHPDYEAWGDMSFGVPMQKADVEAVGSFRWDTNERLVLHIKPVSVIVRGDFAVVLSVYSGTMRNRETGEVVTTTFAWTDICVRENGRWYWIADHGSPVAGG